MIECVHAYWLFLWFIALFSRYSHRNCIINYKCGCQGCRMECPGEDLERLNFPWLSQGRAWEFSRCLACWIEMFSVCLATARAPGALIFQALFFFISAVSTQQQWNLCSWDGSWQMHEASSCFIIVHTHRGCFSLCNQEERLRYMWNWLSCLWKISKRYKLSIRQQCGAISNQKLLTVDVLCGWWRQL